MHFFISDMLSDMHMHCMPWLILTINSSPCPIVQTHLGAQMIFSLFKFRLMFMILGILCFFNQTISHAGSPEHNEGPCIKIMEACKAAGYNKSLPAEKKSLSKNCLQPLLEGQKVEGVVFESKDLEACKIKKLEIKQNK